MARAAAQAKATALAVMATKTTVAEAAAAAETAAAATATEAEVTIEVDCWNTRATRSCSALAAHQQLLRDFQHDALLRQGLQLLQFCGGRTGQSCKLHLAGQC